MAAINATANFRENKRTKRSLLAPTAGIGCLVTANSLVFIAGVGLLVATMTLRAAVLPEDRADVLYHSYDGGGVTIDGPSVLVRKSVGKQTSIAGNYYVDSVSSASIDVISTASPYTEKREEKSASVDYLSDDSILSAAYTLSEERDFTAKSAHFSFSQQMFGDLTTVNMGYSRGWDEVRKRDQDDFKKDVDRQHYRINVSQVVTKNANANLSWETITDEGYLNNPYRSVRYIDATRETGYGYEPERYPRTRTSHAVSVRGKYFLPYRAAMFGEYRFFRDTWGIRAFDFEIGYTHPFAQAWLIETSYRYYQQQQADFFSDLYPFADSQNYLARDKELSAYASHSIGVGVTYEFSKGIWAWIEKGTLNAKYTYIQFNYDSFRNVNAEGTSTGQEPRYQFNAAVVQLYGSIWY